MAYDLLALLERVVARLKRTEHPSRQHGRVHREATGLPPSQDCPVPAPVGWFRPALNRQARLTKSQE